MLDRIKATHKALLKDMEEYRELLCAGASTASGPHGQTELFQYLENIQHAVNDIRGRLGGDDRDVLGVVEATLLKIGDLVAADDGLMGRLDFLVTMLMAVRGDKVDTPRQAVVLPGNYAEPPALWSELRKPEEWTKTLEDWRESDFQAGKGVWKKKMRLFLICAQTHQLVPCGHNGRGYDVQRYRKWVGMTVDVAKFALEVIFATLGSMALAQIPSTILADTGEQAVEAALSGIQQGLEALVIKEEQSKEVFKFQSRTLPRILRLDCHYPSPSISATNASGTPPTFRRRPSIQVHARRGKPYECLRTFVHEMEDTARVTMSDERKKAHKERRAPPSTSEFVYFEQVMSKVQPRAGDGEAQWVLKEHEQAWHDAARKAQTS